MVVVDKANEVVGGKAKAKEEAKKDIDSYRPGFSFTFSHFYQNIEDSVWFKCGRGTLLLSS